MPSIRYASLLDVKGVRDADVADDRDRSGSAVHRLVEAGDRILGRGIRGDLEGVASSNQDQARSSQV